MPDKIESSLNETRAFPPSDAFVRQANVSGIDGYRALAEAAEQDYAGYWAKLAHEHIEWHKPFGKTLDESNAPFYKWFEDGELNVSYNCLDRHLATQPDKTAIIFESDDGQVSKVSYRELHGRVCQFANGLKSRGIKKGDRVVIYLPRRWWQCRPARALARSIRWYSAVSRRRACTNASSMRRPAR